MPNESPNSPLLAAIMLLIGLLAPSERARLRVWVLSRYDAGGYALGAYRDPDHHSGTSLSGPP